MTQPEPGPVRVLPRVVRRALPRDLQPGDLIARSYGPGRMRWALMRVVSVEKRPGVRGVEYLVRVELPEGMSPNDLTTRYVLAPSVRERVYSDGPSHE